MRETLKTHRYKNAYVEEAVNENGVVTSYKQWNDGELIIHREWEYDGTTLILYKDILRGIQIRQWLPFVVEKINF